MSTEKSTVRAEALARRAEAFARFGDTASSAACAALGQFLVARFGLAQQMPALAGYMPMRSEIDPRPAMLAHPGPVCVPVIAALHSPLLFHRWAPDMAMVPGRFGADVPAKPDPIVPQVLIVPLLAFDACGYRLGYGGGFYDRTLARLRAAGPVLAIGFAFAAQEQPSVPIEPTDERLDVIVTEKGILQFAD